MKEEEEGSQGAGTARELLASVCLLLGREILPRLRNGAATRAMPMGMPEGPRPRMSTTASGA